ncbi:heavy metal translocating P-type ATPase [Diaphorobacter aerolatus]|uniref:Heavy metal translocating P-type ATPase n=1 Tax=Diaphorobacter aerolatus TaxID=1288495 RepID=A0A7H0GPJ3_9BURK|nr:heavy metal translocating P-type ATPase [Diaphorobacter aerolatus]QNP50209.1 heavy metal translocating P-type ATPase [Diaphorobacter aerolatus]
MSECGSKGCGCSAVAMPSPKPNTVDAALRQVRYRIENMDCPTEEALIRDKLGKVPGVGGLEFNLVQRTLGISYQPASLRPIEEALSAIGMRAVRMDEKAAQQSTVLSIQQMDCPTEEALIRGKLAGVPGVANLEFNLVQRSLQVGHTPDALPHVLAALKSLGFDAEIRTASAPSAAEAQAPARTNWWPLVVSGVAATLAEVVYWLNGGNHWAVVALALVAILTGGLTTYKKGWIALRNRNLNMNALMSIAVTGAMLIGHWPEAAMVMVLFALAEVIEAKSLDRARNAIRGLMDLAPDTALVQQADGGWAAVDAKAVPVGSRVRVKPGERIALDGLVVEGRSTVNQAPITGESLPVDKAEGDSVFAGTINGEGSFEFRVTAAASASTLARIIHAVEAAQGSRAPTQRFVDQFARLYTPIVFAVALAVALVPPLVFGGPWLDWIYKALVLLVIACPCALVISTPVSIVSGLAAAARRGILIKGGVYLEEGHKLKWLALDKTGTITHGKPAQTDFAAWSNADPDASRLLAASLAARSDHPVSLAVARAAVNDGLTPRDVADFAALPGRGVRGRIDGQIYHLGNHRLVEELDMCSPALELRVSALEAEGKTVVALIGQDGVRALFAVADTVKDSSRQAIAELHSLGIKAIMLTGDNPHTATAIASQVGIDRSRGNLLPEDKLREVEQLSADGKTGMVGDGINDAPALARADIGFAMGAAGTDTAIETADVALMDDDLRKLPTFVRLSRATASILKQNIALALGIKAVFLILTFTGQATMWMAVFADMGASLLVVGNGLRLLRR